MFLATVILFLSCIEITPSSSNLFSLQLDQTRTWWLRCANRLQFQLQQLIWWNCTASIRFERWLQQCFRKNQTCTIFQSQQLEDFFQNLSYFVHFRAVFIDSFSFAMKRCNTSQGFGAFFVQWCDRFLFHLNFFSRFLRSFLIFFNSGHQMIWISNDYNQLGATRLVGYLAFDIQRALVE